MNTIIREFIVWKKDLIGGKFVRILETKDGDFFRCLGSGDSTMDQYEYVSPAEVRLWEREYNDRIKKLKGKYNG